MSTVTRLVLLLAVARSACADFGLLPHCSEHDYSVLEPGFLIYFTQQGTRFELFLRDCRKNLHTAAIFRKILPTELYIARNYFSYDDFTTFLIQCTKTDGFAFNENIYNDYFAKYLEMKIYITSVWFQHCCLEEKKSSYGHEIRNLNLTHNSLGAVEDPAMFNAFSNLEIIDLSYNLIDYIQENTFQRLPRIQRVHLERNRISSFSVNLFNGLRYLKEVDLSNNLITHVVTGSFAGSRLEKLNLSGNGLTFMPSNFLSSLQGLKRFDFEGNFWQCACLGELLNELKRANVQYSRDTFNGRIRVCVAINWKCIRPRENV